jgi:hypothetical protein
MQGNFLSDQEENGLTVQLYIVGSFYAEVTYDSLANKILRYRAFEGTEQLAPCPTIRKGLKCIREIAHFCDVLLFANLLFLT